jgi:hypothetical protein
MSTAAATATSSGGTARIVRLMTIPTTASSTALSVVSASSRVRIPLIHGCTFFGNFHKKLDAALPFNNQKLVEKPSSDDTGELKRSVPIIS